MRKALIIIDIQNEYSNQGQLQIDNFDEVVLKINKLDLKPYQLVIAVRHLNQAGLFSSKWATDYPESLVIPYDYEVLKTTADSFHQTNLQTILEGYQINELEICGFMTQNCVTYTALCGLNHNYRVSVIANLCSTIDETVHNIAIRSLATKVNII